MSLICRQARLDDLKAVDALVVASINDLTERHGLGKMAAPGVTAFPRVFAGR